MENQDLEKDKNKQKKGDANTLSDWQKVGQGFISFCVLTFKGIVFLGKMFLKFSEWLFKRFEKEISKKKK